MADGDLVSTSNAPDPESALDARRDAVRAAIADGRSDVLPLWLDYLAEFQMQNPEANEYDAVASFDEILQVLTSQEAGDYAAIVLSADASALTQPSEKNVDARVDPITLFDGQFLYEANDMEIDGAGITFEFTRTYRNQANALGPLGANWDHRYNLRLVTSGDLVIRTTGALKSEAYIRHPLYGQAGRTYWTPPPGQHATISDDGAGSFVWRTPGGIRNFYEADLSHPGEHRIRRMEDRFGNYLSFRYVNGLLVTIEINQQQRLVHLSYDEFDRISEVRDYATTTYPNGRAWTYSYDDCGDLVAVTAPATDEFPAGATTQYEYSSAFASGVLAHNLVRIVDPEGQVYLENEYGDGAGLLTFNRVTSQRQGAGSSSFEYEEVDQIFEEDYDAAERPARLTRMISRNGHYTSNLYNASGNLLRKEETVLERGLLRTLQWNYRYNADGALIETVTPEGAVSQYLYGRDYFLVKQGITDADVRSHPALAESAQRAFGNLLASVRRGKRAAEIMLAGNSGPWSASLPDVLTNPDATDIIVKYEYEPGYCQLLSVSDPRFTRSADPAVHQAPAEDPRHLATLTRFDYRGPSGDPYRLLASVRFAKATLPDGTIQPSGARTYPTYDRRGRVIRTVDANGVVTENGYFTPSAGLREGYLRKRTIGPQNLAITESYEVDEHGRVRTITRPLGQGRQDGRFVTTIVSDSRDDVVLMRNSAPFADEVRHSYDRNRQRVQSSRDLRDDNGFPILGGIEARKFVFDSQFNLLEESLGGSDPQRRLTTRHRYNESDKLVRTIHPGGSETWRGYDPRLNCIGVTRAGCTSEASIVRAEYNGDGLRVRTVDPRGFATQYQYDAFGRLVATIDPLGNEWRTDYDKSGNVVAERAFEPNGNGYRLLRRVEYSYDELNRLTVERMCLFDSPLPAIDPIVDYVASAGPWTMIETQYFYDAGGQLIKTRHPDGGVTTRKYDPRGLPVEEINPVGIVTTSAYDTNGNLTQKVVQEPVADPATGAVVRYELFATTFTYDELDRVVSVTDSLGNTTQYKYDSRDRIVSQTDPLGNVTRHEYDLFGRCVAKICERTATGVGAGAPLAPIVTRFEYDDEGNRTAVIDAAGNRTSYRFDALNRRLETTWPDSAVEQFRYDASGNMILCRDCNGVLRRQTADPLNRTTHIAIDFGGADTTASLSGPLLETFTFDGLDRQTSGTNDYIEVVRKFDSLDCPIEETTKININEPGTVAASTRRLMRRYDAVGRLISLESPDSRKISYVPDALGRIQKIQHIASGRHYSGSAAAQAPFDLLRQSYIGRRIDRTDFGNAWSIARRYDGNRRTVSLGYMAPTGGAELETQFLYDAANRMRYKNDIRSVGNVGDRYFYDSLGRLTRIVSAQSLAPLPLASIAPVSAPPAPGLPHPQGTIDGLIGPLADDPAQFTYRYDEIGNRTAERASGGIVTYQSNSVSEYRDVSGQARTYDRNGNLRTDGQFSYSYDSRNRLSRVDSVASGALIARFVHDCDGRRIVISEGGSISELVHNGPNVIEEYRNGSLFASYVHEYASDTLCHIAVGQADYYVARDLVSSTRLITDSAGQVAARYRFSAFGETLEDAQLANHYKFCGRRLDPTIASYDFRARQYAPQLGRFLQRDAAEGGNPYAFLDNNPLTATDPSGMVRQPLELRMELFDGSVYPPSSPEYSLGVFNLKLRDETLAAYTDRTWWGKGGGNMVLGGSELIGGGLLLAVATVASDGAAAVLLGVGAALGLSTGLVQTTEGGFQLWTADKRTADQDIRLNQAMAEASLITGSVGGLAGATVGGIAGSVAGDGHKGAVIGATAGAVTEAVVHLGFSAASVVGMARSELRFSQLARKTLSQSDGWGRGRRNAVLKVFNISKDATRRANPLFVNGFETLTLSHFIPRRIFGGGGRIEGVLNRPWNLKPLWDTEHALCDPERFAALLGNPLFVQANEGFQLSGIGKWALRAPDWMLQSSTGLAMGTTRTLQLDLMWR